MSAARSAQEPGIDGKAPAGALDGFSAADDALHGDSRGRLHAPLRQIGEFAALVAESGHQVTML
jgi:hypothetical protein